MAEMTALEKSRYWREKQKARMNLGSGKKVRAQAGRTAEMAEGKRTSIPETPQQEQLRRQSASLGAVPSGKPKPAKKAAPKPATSAPAKPKPAAKPAAKSTKSSAKRVESKAKQFARALGPGKSESKTATSASPAPAGKTARKKGGSLLRTLKAAVKPTKTGYASYKSFMGD